MVAPAPLYGTNKTNIFEDLHHNTEANLKFRPITDQTSYKVILDYFRHRTKTPSKGLCNKILGVPKNDKAKEVRNLIYFF